MFCLLASFTLAFAPLANDDAAAKELTALAQKVTEAESYSFTFLPSKQEEVKDAKPWQVEVKKKLPYHYQRGDVDFFKSDEKLVMKGKDGKWTLADAAERANHPTPNAGGATAPKKGDDGGDKKGEPGKSGEGGEHKVGLERLVVATETIPLPHRLFNDFAAKLAEVTKESKDGAVVYHVKLTPAATREMMNARAGRAAHAGGKGEGKHPGGGAGGAPAGSGGGGDAAPKHEAEASGTMAITVKGDVIETVDFDLEVKAKAGDRKAGGIVAISKLNATNLVLPPEVATALGIGGSEKK